MTAAREMEGYDVVVVGGGNSAGQAAIHLAKFARSVTILVRRDGLEATMSSYLIGEIAYNPRITVLPCAEVVDGGGDGRLEWIRVRDTDTGARGERRVPRARSCCSAPSRTATGCRRAWRATRAASCSPGATCRLSGGSTASRPASLETHRARRLRRRGHPGRVDEAGRRGQRRGRLGGAARARLARPEAD